MANLIVREGIPHFEIEEVLTTDHNHQVDVPRDRGLSIRQKSIVNLCVDRGQGAPKKVVTIQGQNFLNKAVDSYLNDFKLFLSQIIREFHRLQQIAAAAGEVHIPIPTNAMLSSYTSHQRSLLRGGVAVGGQSLQSIVDFAEDHKLKPMTGVNEGFCVSVALLHP